MLHYDIFNRFPHMFDVVNHLLVFFFFLLIYRRGKEAGLREVLEKVKQPQPSNQEKPQPIPAKVNNNNNTTTHLGPPPIHPIQYQQQQPQLQQPQQMQPMYYQQPYPISPIAGFPVMSTNTSNVPATPPSNYSQMYLGMPNRAAPKPPADTTVNSQQKTSENEQTDKPLYPNLSEYMKPNTKPQNPVSPSNSELNTSTGALLSPKKSVSPTTEKAKIVAAKEALDKISYNLKLYGEPPPTAPGTTATNNTAAIPQLLQLDSKFVLKEGLSPSAPPISTRSVCATHTNILFIHTSNPSIIFELLIYRDLTKTLSSTRGGKTLSRTLTQYIEPILNGKFPIARYFPSQFFPPSPFADLNFPFKLSTIQTEEEEQNGFKFRSFVRAPLLIIPNAGGNRLTKYDYSTIAKHKAFSFENVPQIEGQEEGMYIGYPFHSICTFHCLFLSISLIYRSLFLL